MIQDRLASLSANITSVCNRLGKNPEDITLIGVTKTAESPLIQEALDAGLLHIGENRVQEGARKFPSLQGPIGFKKHLIGHLQTNKVKQALEFFDCIDSVDSLKLANEIQKQAQKLNRVVDVLIQVNTSQEEQKYGVGLLEAEELVEQVSALENIRIQGLMTIAMFTDDESLLRPCFQALKHLFDQFAVKFEAHPTTYMRYLSMGMSNDFALAIEEGSNMIRVGRAIFQ